MVPLRAQEKSPRAQVAASANSFTMAITRRRPGLHPIHKTKGTGGPGIYANPELGFLGGFSSLYWPGIIVTQYWRSFDHLVGYAQSRNAAHLPAWKAFNQRVGEDGTVGIWHETYQVAAGQYEAIHVNMPRFGLALAGTHEPAVGHFRDARSRMQP